MATQKATTALDRLISLRDEKEYAKVNSRMKLAARIADAIKKQGLTQKEFAAKLDKKPSEISKWLSGNHNFTHDILCDIQSVLKIELFKYDDCNAESSKIEDTYSSMKERFSRRGKATII